MPAWPLFNNRWSFSQVPRIRQEEVHLIPWTSLLSMRSARVRNGCCQSHLASQPSKSSQTPTFIWLSHYNIPSYYSLNTIYLPIIHSIIDTNQYFHTERNLNINCEYRINQINSQAKTSVQSKKHFHGSKFSTALQLKRYCLRGHRSEAQGYIIRLDDKSKEPVFWGDILPGRRHQYCPRFYLMAS